MTKYLPLLLTTALLAGCKKDDDTAPKDQNAENKALVTRAVTALFNTRTVAAVDTYWGVPYVQHNPTFPDGRDALRVVPTLPGIGYQNARTLADGEFVLQQGRYTGLAATPVVVFDLYRLKDGKLAEHWDGITPEAPANPSGHTQLDGATALTDLSKTADNKALVKDFVETILVRGETAKLGNYFNGNSYVQHNSGIADNLTGLNAGLTALAQQGITMRYNTVHKVIGEGNFVLTQSEGLYGPNGGRRTAFYDLFRVENGKVAEHWDVIQQVPATSQNPNGMF